MEVDQQEKLEKRLPAIGEDEFEEKMIVGGVELTPESSLKALKQACKFLGVGVTGSKQLLWQRLKKEVAETKLKTLVDISKAIQKEFERDPTAQRQPYEPSAEEKALHELTHLPKADWCESCTATRSREDNFETSKKKYDGSLVITNISIVHVTLRAQCRLYVSHVMFRLKPHPRQTVAAVVKVCRLWLGRSGVEKCRVDHKIGSKTFMVAELLAKASS